ncbi:MAG: nuclear transport factor 2 family protein [Halieaceae bacterium]
MSEAIKVFMDYAAEFEKTYVDNDWSRLNAYFPEDAVYEVRGGPMACRIQGREAIFKGIQKSLDGLDRRFDGREIELLEGPDIQDVPGGEEISIAWRITYTRENCPAVQLPGRSVFAIDGGKIVAMRDEYDDAEMGELQAWIEQYGDDIDGSYV